MRFASRDADGNITGHYTCPQPFAQEELADDHPDIVAFEAAVADRRAAAVTQK